MKNVYNIENGLNENSILNNLVFVANETEMIIIFQYNNIIK